MIAPTAESGAMTVAVALSALTATVAHAFDHAHGAADVAQGFASVVPEDFAFCLVDYAGNLANVESGTGVSFQKFLSMFEERAGILHFSVKTATVNYVVSGIQIGISAIDSFAATFTGINLGKT